MGTGLAAAFVGNSPTHGLNGFPAFLGLALQVGILTTLIAFVVMAARRLPRLMLPGMAYAVPDRAPLPGMGQRLAPRFAARGGYGPTASGGLSLTAVDFTAFERALKDVNAAWSRQDIPALQSLCTRDMLQHFADDLARLATRGLRNQTRDVTMDRGDLAEAWRDGDLEHASVAMRISLIDVTRRAADNVVMIGDPVKRIQVSEVWTFVRRRGQPWLLSAIQQTH